MLNKSTSLREEHLLVANEARKYLIDFSIATDKKYQPNHHHEEIARELEKLAEWGDKQYKILILCEPPRHGKSQQATIDFPAWFLGKYPGKEIITASYSGELALDFGTKTREKVESEAYRFIFKTRLREDERSKGKWRTQEGGSYTSVGVGGATTGRGAHCVLIDDPIKNREEAESEVYREKVWSWFTSTAFTRLEPNGVIVLILTRWHTDDLAGRILANKELSGRVKVMSFPAVKDDTALWPERFSLEALEEIKHTLGPYDWSALYQQQPITSANQEFKKEWFRPIEEEKVALMNTRNFLTIDTAISKQSSADYTGFCDNAINQENYWHLKAWRMKVDAAELVRLLFTLYEKRHYEKIGIEKTAYLDGLKPFLEEEQRKRDVFLPIVELKHNQIAKEIRIRGLIPRYSSGSIFHISAKDLENELLVFPLGANDYVADATAYQLQIAESSFPKPFTQLPTQPISKYQGTVQNREMSVILDKDIFGSEKPKRRFNQGEPEKVSRYQG